MGKRRLVILILKKLRYKNFLSAGNTFTEIDFLASESTLIIGDNGAGKSTINDALSYALFNKAHRNINKPNLVNSINGKQCVVEVEFEAHNQDYKVIRGQKPTKFEIWKGDTLINQDSHNKEYQKFLEQNILKLNHKSFHQVVVLGSSSFVPFMQLSTGQRREVIEDLLDISIFSRMNVLLKEKQSRLRDDIRAGEYEISLAENKIESIEENIKNIESVNKEYQERTKARLSDLEETLVATTKEKDTALGTAEEKRQSIQSKATKVKKRTDKLSTFKTKMESEIASLTKTIEFFDERDNCPTCHQELSGETKKTHITKNETRKSAVEEALAELVKEIEKADQEREYINEQLNELANLDSFAAEKTSEVNSLTRDIASLEKSLDEAVGFQELQDAREQLKRARKGLHEKRNALHALNESESYQRVISEMLKDSGIKTKIIKEYIPVINTLVNKYLEALDFYVSFELDETFTEVIKSRHRDEFTYSSFSEGEKTKIDVALLFAWRHIAKMKNSLSTNLLILDETFDSSLDQEGIENLMTLIRTMADQINIFVISHKAELHERFERTMKFSKVRNFSQYEFV